MPRHFVSQLFGKLAPRIGARLLCEPRWGVVGQITFKNKRRRYFRSTSFDLNTMGASEIARDKNYADFFMRRIGYPTIPGRGFYSARWAKAIGSKDSLEAAYRYAKKLGFPVVVKPNSASQGRAVEKVHTRETFYRAFRAAAKIDNVVLVQRHLRGRDYRVVVLDKKVISAYERIPLSVIGDGRASIKQLLLRKQREFEQSGRDTRIKLRDPRIANKLRHDSRSFASRPARGEEVFLLDNANLSTGGESRDVTESMSAAYKRIAVGLTRDMGLRLCGVDLMLHQGGIESVPRRGRHDYTVIEINSAPGLDHYASAGRRQKRIVEGLYLDVLRALERATR